MHRNLCNDMHPGFMPGSITFGSAPDQDPDIKRDTAILDLVVRSHPYDRAPYLPPAPPRFLNADTYERPIVRFYRLEHAMAVATDEQSGPLESLPIPAYASAGAAGMDFRAAIYRPFTIYPGCAAKIPTGFNIAIPDGWEGQARGRSGLALKRRVALTHGVGTVDCDYRGEPFALLTNHGDKPFVINRGDRIMQMVFSRAPQLPAMEVFEDFSAETARGTGGYGSTGVS